MNIKFIVLIILLVFTTGCAISPLLVTSEDLNKGNSFICTMIHTEGTPSVGNIFAEILSKSDSRKSKFVDLVESFSDGVNLSVLNNKGLPYSMSQIKAVPKSSLSTISVYAFYTTKDGGLSPNYVGKIDVKLKLEEDNLYAFVTEVDAEEETVYLDVYEIKLNDLKQILKTEGDTFLFTERILPIIKSNKRIHSKLNFSSK